MDKFEQGQEQEFRDRPTIVTVFAILTIIGNALAIIFTLFPLDTFTQNMGPGAPEPPEWIRFGALPLALGKLAAAILLLQMRKVGFYIYAVSETLYAILQIVAAKVMIDLFGPYEAYSNLPISFKMITIISTVVTLAFSIVWIGGYASQLNKMR